MRRHPWTGVIAGALAMTICGALTAAPPPPSSDATDCSTGVVMDDGDPETGYGFVPSATEGIYLQSFDSADFPRPQLKKVCVCMLKTRGPSDARFEVVFYKDSAGKPDAEPYASFRAKATDLARTKETAGRFYEVDVSGVVLPPGKSYIGARWDPSKQTFFFVCTDTSEATEKVDVFFREDAMPGWSHVDQSPDPIFSPHKSILVRAVAATAEEAAAAEEAAKNPRFVQGAASATPPISPPRQER